MTYLNLEAAIINVSPKATAVVCGFGFKLPWEDEYFDLTPDPKDVKKDDLYQFSYDPMSTYPREWVLNHRTYEEGVLTQTSPAMKGIILARGVKPIPKDMRGETKIKVIVYDQKGKKHAGEFRVSLDRHSQDRAVLPDGDDFLRV